MKTFAKTMALMCLSASPLAFADSHRFTDYAKVTRATPVYQTVEHRIPQESCWVETVRTERNHRHNDSATSTLVGGLIGGAIGHAVGRGKSNKKLGAVVGSVVGMSVGHDIGHKNHRTRHQTVSYDDVERCEVSYRTEVEERLSGYDVTYLYRGESYKTHMKTHPGKRIKVAVNVRPVVNY